LASQAKKARKARSTALRWVRAREFITENKSWIAGGLGSMVAYGILGASTWIGMGAVLLTLAEAGAKGAAIGAAAMVTLSGIEHAANERGKKNLKIANKAERKMLSATSEVLAAEDLGLQPEESQGSEVPNRKARKSVHREDDPGNVLPPPGVR